jgi:hypothetical protein
MKRLQQITANYSFLFCSIPHLFAGSKPAHQHKMCIVHNYFYLGHMAQELSLPALMVIVIYRLAESRRDMTFVSHNLQAAFNRRKKHNCWCLRALWGYVCTHQLDSYAVVA